MPRTKYRWTETGYEATRALLDAPEPPTAIFAGNDLQALGVYRALYEAGLRTPDDMSVVGFDDLPLAGLLTPASPRSASPCARWGRWRPGCCSGSSPGRGSKAPASS